MLLWWFVAVRTEFGLVLVAPAPIGTELVVAIPEEVGNGGNPGIR